MFLRLFVLYSNQTLFIMHFLCITAAQSALCNKKEVLHLKNAKKNPTPKFITKQIKAPTHTLSQAFSLSLTHTHKHTHKLNRQRAPARTSRLQSKTKCLYLRKITVKMDICLGTLNQVRKR